MSDNTLWQAIATSCAAVGTVGATIIAVYRDAWRNFYRRPRLKFEDQSNPWIVRAVESDGEFAHYVGVSVLNFGKSDAEEVQLFVMGIEKDEADGAFQRLAFHAPKNLLISSSGDQVLRTAWKDVPMFFDIGRLRNREVGGIDSHPKSTERHLVLAFRVKHFSKDHLLSPGRYFIHLRLASKNAGSMRAIVEIIFDGDWSEDEEEMRNHLSARYVAVPI